MSKLLNATLILLCTLSLGACNPFKVTDPDHPKFDPVAFQLQDYVPMTKFKNVIPKLFKIGDTQEYVELMLVERGGASKKYLENAGFYVYSFRPKYFPDFHYKVSYNIGISYTEDNKLLCFTLNTKSMLGQECRFLPPTYKPLPVQTPTQTKEQ